MSEQERRPVVVRATVEGDNRGQIAIGPGNVQLQVGAGKNPADKVRVLFLAANPASAGNLLPADEARDVAAKPAAGHAAAAIDRLGLDEEIREITARVRASKHRGALKLITRWAVRAGDLPRALDEHLPHVVHFSGHGLASEALVVVGEGGQARPVSKEALVQLFRAAKDNVRVILLNACHSRPLAEAVTEVIDCAVGMNGAVGDAAAVTFAAAFYAAVGAGRSVRTAFERARWALRVEHPAEQDTPALLVRKGVDAKEVVLLRPR